MGEIHDTKRQSLILDFIFGADGTHMTLGAMVWLAVCACFGGSRNRLTAKVLSWCIEYFPSKKPVFCLFSNQNSLACTILTCSHLEALSKLVGKDRFPDNGASRHSRTAMGETAGKTLPVR